MKSLISRSTLLFLILVTMGCTGTGEPSGNECNFPDLSGPYLGQALPDTIPVLFAPGVVSTGMFTRDVTITPDGKEIYFCVAIGNYTYFYHPLFERGGR